MKATIAKQFTFSASHHLPYHDGKCRNDHGHNFRVEVAVTGDVRETDESDPQFGMVMDFARLSDFWKLRCEPMLDHHNLNETLPGIYPTAEAIAYWLLLQFTTAFGEEVHIEHVRVWETDTAWALVKMASDI